MGPEALSQYLNADEAIKRLAAAQGIDVLNLVKSVEERQQDAAEQQQQMQQASMMQQAGQFANSPMMDPTKNPNAQDAMAAAMQQYTGMSPDQAIQQAQAQQPQPAPA